MRVAVVDIGSNTARLLVAEASAEGPVRIRGEKAYLGLGAEILHTGSIGDAKLLEAARVARRYVRMARKLGAARLDVLVTAPGRQAANADELLHAIARATRTSVRGISAEEEAELAFAGAVAAEPRLGGTVAVVDVGGGSTEIAVGEARGLPTWCRSVDVGSLRLAAKALPSDPPRAKELEAARAEVAAAFAGLEPPPAEAARAVGGSARALARVVGRTLGVEELERALDLVSARRSAKVAQTFGLDDERARVLPAGALVLAGVAGLLGMPLRLARGGLREGAAASLLSREAAA